jgi:hypothetical protein
MQTMKLLLMTEMMQWPLLLLMELLRSSQTNVKNKQHESMVVLEALFCLQIDAVAQPCMPTSCYCVC